MTLKSLSIEEESLHNLVNLSTKLDVLHIGDVVCKFKDARASTFNVFFNNNIKIIRQVYDSCIENQLYTNEIKNYLSDSISNKLNSTKIQRSIYYLTKLVFLTLIYCDDARQFDKKIDINSNVAFSQSMNEETIESVMATINEQNQFYYFRGQTNESIHMLPTMLRSLGENVVVNKAYIEKRINDSGLGKKFEKYMDNSPYKALNIYDKLAFLQHATPYSPFIDITHNFQIATSFALSNATNVNEYQKINAGVFGFLITSDISDVLVTNSTEAERILSKVSFACAEKGYFTFGGKLQAHLIDEKGQRRKKEYLFDSFAKIIKHLQPRAYIFDCPTNDRMRYQQGAFLYFCGEDLVVFNNRIFYELSPDIRFTKWVIFGSDKNDIKTYIYKNYREYDINHLMDPYLLFKE